MSFGSSNTESLALGHACIVGECVYICIECLKYYDKIYDILLWKKKCTFIVFRFSSQSFTMLCNGSFHGFENPKNNGMNGLIDYLESMMQFEPN